MPKRNVNPKSLANLRPPWKPGQSGNPEGINRKRPITDEYFALADLVIPEEIRKRIPAKIRPAKGTTFAQANSLRRWMDSMLQGGHGASKELREAMEGRAPQRLEITGPERKEITIRVIEDRSH